MSKSTSKCRFRRVEIQMSNSTSKCWFRRLPRWIRSVGLVGKKFSPDRDWRSSLVHTHLYFIWECIRLFELNFWAHFSISVIKNQNQIYWYHASMQTSVQYHSKKCVHRSDIWQFGFLIFGLISGSLNWESENVYSAIVKMSAQYHPIEFHIHRTL